MRSSGTISLFSVQSQSDQQPYSILVSAVAHCVVVALVSLGILSQPQIKEHALAEHYTLRHVELHQPDAPARRAEQSGIGYPRAKTSAAASHGPAPRPASMRLTAKLKVAHQTLIQPRIPKEVEVAIEIPVPAVVIWSPEKTPVKTIVPPQPAKPTAADVKPSVAPPDVEVNLADVAISSTAFAANQPIVATTTSPLVVQGPQQPQMPPATTSDSTAQPTPTAVLSLSDLSVKDGDITLPPVNESAASSSSGLLAAGTPDDSASGAANGDAAGASGTTAGSDLNQSGAKTGPAMGAETGDGTGSSALITLPKDGNFGVVVVGSALEEKYPETADLWNGRLAYTVYLHVGLAKSWILQYSLPRAADAAAGGNATRLEAPWPYNIVRPNLAPGAINADALMVRGIVNAAGHFEALDIVFPQPFAQAEFVLNSLAQWQFRPATQGGQIIPVEVLLIIPDIE